MSYKSILVIKPSSLGDIVHTLPAVAAIRDANPDAKITWVINPEWAPLLRGNRDIDHVHIFPRSEFRGLGAPKSLLPWLMKTRALRPEVAIDFQGLLRSALIARISGAPDVFGLSDAREGSRFLYQHVVRVDRHEHAVERYLKLAEKFGAPLRGPARFSLPTGDELPRFDEEAPFVLLHPFARGRGKSMTDRAVRDFCEGCAPSPVVVVGKSKLRVKAPDNCIDLSNQTTLLQLIRLIRMAGFVVSVDSGPMHIAAAITDRLVSIHTWTDPRRVGPYNPNAWVWRNGDLQRMRDFAPTAKLPRGRRFRRADLPPIIKLVTQQLSAPLR